MIPLRILHQVPDPTGTEAQAVRPVLDALATEGHEGAWLCPAPTTPADDHRTVVTFTPGWWRWWRSERQATVQRVAAWTPDLLHVHSLEHLGATLDIARRLGLSVVATMHELAEPHAARRLRDNLVAWVLVPSEHHRAHYLAQVGVPRDRIVILPSGVAITAEPEACTTANGWSVGLVDQEEDDEGATRFLTAVAELQAAGLPLHAQILCDDADRADDLNRLAADRHATVTLVPGDDLRGFLAQVDVLALASDRSTNPVLPLTAMALGRPLVAVTNGGLPELVRDGVTALLVEPDDHDGLTQGLRQLHSRARREELAQASRALARELYDAHLVAQATLTVYRAMLGDSGTGAKAEVTTTWRRMTDSRVR